MVARVILIGTREYNWILAPFAYLFQKYWGEPVLYIGDTPPDELPDNVTFMQVPAYSEGIWPWTHFFGNGLLSICKYFEGEIIALFLLDHWLNRPIDLAGVNILTEYMDNRRHIIRASLTDDKSWENAAAIDHCDDLDILYIPPWDIHNGFAGGITFCPSLWNTDLLAELIEPHWTLWECEKLGTEKMKGLTFTLRGVTSIGTRPAPLSRTHGLFHAKPKMAHLTGLSEEDRAVVQSFVPEGWKCYP